MKFATSPDMTGNRVRNVADPVDQQDAATKAYVDALSTGGTIVWAVTMRPLSYVGVTNADGTHTVYRLDYSSGSAVRTSASVADITAAESLVDTLTYN